MVSDPNLASLVTALDEGTREGRVSWSETADEKSFRATFAHSMVRLGMMDWPLGPPGLQKTFALTLLNDKGKIVEEWLLDGESGFAGRLVSKHPNFHAVEELYRLARSRARNTPSLIHQIVAEVQSVNS